MGTAAPNDLDNILAEFEKSTISQSAVFTAADRLRA
jgi:hypothetical protein